MKFGELFEAELDEKLNGEFDEKLDKKFAKFDVKFAELEEKFDELVVEFDEMDVEFAELEEEFAELEEVFEWLLFCKILERISALCGLLELEEIPRASRAESRSVLLKLFMNCKAFSKLLLLFWMFC